MNKTLSWLALTLCAALPQIAQAGDLADVKRLGVLRVAVYKEFPPFSDEGKGIDVDLAKALADKLGVRVDVVAVDAQENMDDDLRVWVWKGKLEGLGNRVADVMLHVPIDNVFAARNPQVSILAPYYRETMAMVRNTEKLYNIESVSNLAGATIGVEGDAIAAMVLGSVDGGKIRNNLKHYLKLDDVPADLQSGAIAAFVGTRSQVEPIAKAAGNGFKISMPPPMPAMPQAGWTQGLAVKSEYKDLAAALSVAMQSLEQEGRLDTLFTSHDVKRMKPL
ncbi:MAG TPA: transporter substrate-binding domain-containing protein [Rhodocyclaceae bacterium]